MIKEIRLNGYTEQPSDYTSPDGDLAACLNMISEDDALQPIRPPKELFSLLPDEGFVSVPSFDQADTKTTVLALEYQHTTPSYHHYIFLRTYLRDGMEGVWYSLSWKNRDSIAAGSSLHWTDTTNIMKIYREELKNITSIGNTLIITTSASMYYCLFQDSAYKVLGSRIPNVSMSMSLLGRPCLYSQQNPGGLNITFDSIANEALTSTFTESNKQKISQQVMGALNKFIADNTVNKGRYCFPFFVRYALRLYDGTSLVCHSAPILMNPGTTHGPIVSVSSFSGDALHKSSAQLDMMLMSASLIYKPINDEAMAELLDNWKDIVKSIDIFVSKPLYTYNQDGLCTSFDLNADNYESKFIGRLYAETMEAAGGTVIDWASGTPAENKLLSPIQISAGGGESEVAKKEALLDTYYEWKYSEIYAMYFTSARTTPTYTLHLEDLEDNRLYEDICTEGNFYLLHSIPLDELDPSTGTEIVTPKDYLPSLVSRESMTDDFQTHDTLWASKAFVYNARLNIANIRRTLYGGFKPEAMCARCDCAHGFSVISTNTVVVSKNDSNSRTIDVYTYIKENGNTYTLKNELSEYEGARMSLIDFFSDGGQNRSSLCWFYSPHPGAYKMVISQPGDNTSRRFEIALKPHELLNGAYAMLHYDDERSTSMILLSTGSATIEIPNKIFTSEVNNPFYFPATGVNTVGDGDILALSTATRALSDGQFGKFPLYAFTTEGIWALGVSKDGSPYDVEPLPRDVCINAESVAQLDDAVIFATARGVMIISGSSVACLSDDIKREHPFSSETLPLPLITQLMTADENSAMLTRGLTSFLSSARMLYDYPHQRIYIYNTSDEINYALVYSLKSKRWGRVMTSISNHINSYPEAIATYEITDDDNLITQHVVDFSKEEDADVRGIFVTRPLKLDEPDVYKTVSHIIQRGAFSNRVKQTVLYGSRDLVNWYLVYSSETCSLHAYTPQSYKYFIVASFGTYTDNENAFGLTMQYMKRFDRRLR